MATYHAVMEPVHGKSQAPETPLPLIPWDVEADSAEEAIKEVRHLITEEWFEYFFLRAEGDHFERSEAAGREIDRIQSEWQPVVRRVERPTVAVESRVIETEDILHEGRVVGQSFHYGTDRGAQEFNILVGGHPSGRLVQIADDTQHPDLPGLIVATMSRSKEILPAKRRWKLTEASGPLAFLIGQEWDDEVHPRDFGGIMDPDSVIAEIRRELEQHEAGGRLDVRR